MAVLVKTSLEKAEEFSSKSIHAVIGKKKQPALLRVSVDDSNLEEAIVSYKADKNILMLNYVGYIGYLKEVDRGELQGVYITREFDFGSNVEEIDIVGALESVPAEVTVIVKLPEGYANMQFIQAMSIKYDRVRFCGGYLFQLEGCTLGCCSEKLLESRGIAIKEDNMLKEGCSCALTVYNEKDVELEATSKVAKTSTRKSTTTKAKVSTGEKKERKAKTESTPKKPTSKQQMKNLMSTWGATS